MQLVALASGSTFFRLTAQILIIQFLLNPVSDPVLKILLKITLVLLSLQL